MGGFLNFDIMCMSTIGETSFSLTEPITEYHIDLINHYEEYLMSFGQEKGYSFVWRHGPIEVSPYYQEQYIKHLGTGLKYEITIWGKGEPIFRTVEALMKYFGGYYTYGMDKTTLPYLRGKYYEIYKPGKDGNPEYVFHLVDWEFIAAYFNGTDDQKIKDIYNLSRFEKEEYLFKDY